MTTTEDIAKLQQQNDRQDRAITSLSRRLGLISSTEPADLTATTAPILLYVDDVNGDDSNVGSAAAPLKTQVEAWSRVPFFVKHQVEIVVKPHGGAGYPALVMGNKSLEASVWIIGDGFTELKAAAAAAAGTDGTKVVDPVGGLAVDVFRGKTVEFLDGAAAGFRRMVHSNTASDIVFVVDTDVSGSVVPSSGDSFRIVEPAVRWNISSGVAATETLTVASLAGNNQRITKGVGGVGYVNLGWDDVGDIQMGMLWRNANVHMYGIEMGQPGTRRLDLFWEHSVCQMGGNRSTLVKAGPPFLITAPGLAPPSNDAWTGWGHHRYDTGLVGGSFRSLFQQPGKVDAYFVAAPGMRPEVSNVELIWFGGNVDGWVPTGGRGTRLSMGGFGSTPVRCHASGSAPCVLVPTGVLVDDFGVDFASESGPVYDVEMGEVLTIFSTGQSTSGPTITVGDLGRLATFGAMTLGDAAALDIEVRGGPAVNKSFFAAKDDSIGAAGAFITRGFA